MLVIFALSVVNHMSEESLLEFGDVMLAKKLWPEVLGN